MDAHPASKLTLIFIGITAVDQQNVRWPDIRVLSIDDGDKLKLVNHIVKLYTN